MLKLIKKLALFAPILAVMVFVSYRIDPSGLFWGAGFERMASEYMLDGQYIAGYERLDGRALNEVYAKNVPYAPQVLVNGSSRSMQIDSSFVSEGVTFYNAANVGADVYDFFTSYYIFAKEDKEPEVFVMGIDPWIFNDGEENIDKRSNKELFYEFLGEEMGYTGLEYEKTTDFEKYKALLDPSYFQGSIAYYFRDKSADVQPQPVAAEEIYNQNEVIKAPDGSVIYDLDFRTRSQSEADRDAIVAANTDPILRLGDFDRLSPEYTQLFEKFIEYLQAKNIEIIFYLPPYHHTVYYTANHYKDIYHCLFETEDYLNDVAEKYGIRLYGSYNPDMCGLTNADFMDGMHARQESVRKILPLIK